ncbi:MFS transporter [Rheinheimera fenheensis]|uniref:MFS transporter n=1 Tax=Rheinheimera fenheensis TaxID=3152295 RepID=UPI00325DBAE6
MKKAYQVLFEEDDGRACKDIPDAACSALPANFFLLLIAQSLTALADLISNPKTVLSWLGATLGVPAGFIAWLVPLREAGSMLPQLLIGAWVRQFAIRKRFLLGGSALQAVALAGMALCALTLQGYIAGIAILSLLLLFSLARGFNSVAMKDVVGKTIPKGRRGRLGGIATAIAGIMTAICALTLYQLDTASVVTYSVLLFIAAALWLLAALLFTGIHEHAGATDGGVNAWHQALSNIGLLRQDNTLRNFVLCRAMLSSSALALPFVVVMTQQYSADGKMLAVLLVASSLATALTGPLWGKLADRNSKTVLFYAGLLSAAGCAATLLLPVQNLIAPLWALPVLFIVLSIAHGGVRLARKTYLLDIATGNTRTDYVSVSNSVIGLFLLIMGGVAALFASYSVNAVIGLFCLFNVIGALIACSMTASK